MATLAHEDESALVAAAVERSLFTAAEGDEALRAAERTGRPVSEVLVERGLLAPRTIESLRAGLASRVRTVRTTAPAVGALQVPARIGDFEVLEKLGEGGMGAVYRARQVALDREVALKIVSPSVVLDPEHAERFLREARAAAKVNHPNVITIFDAGAVDGRLIMALELMRGGDAAQLAKRAGGQLPEARAVQVVRDCARGLQALEKAGLVHRDIKPANVFIGADGAAKLADLGLARSRAGDDRVTNSGVIVGTPAFMAPEQADGSPDIDVRTDIYALGATLYQLVTGEPPYTGSSPLVVVSKVLTAAVPDPRRLRPDLSQATAQVITRALAKDRGERFQTATELVVALEGARAALGGRPSGRQGPKAAPRGSARQARPAAATGPAPRAGSWPVVAAGVAMLVTFGVSAASLLRRDPPATPAQAEASAPGAPVPPRPPRSAPSSPAGSPAPSDAWAGSDRRQVPVTFRWDPSRSSAEVTPLGEGRYAIVGAGAWGRVSLVSDRSFALPRRVRFKVGEVAVSTAARALEEQGFDIDAGFFDELGVRLDRPGATAESMHADAGAALTDAVWLSLLHGPDGEGGRRVQGLMRAVGEGRVPGTPLTFAPRAEGLVVLYPREAPPHGGRSQVDFDHVQAGQAFQVVMTLTREKVTCELEPIGDGKQRGRTFEATWEQLRLSPPERVWVWAQVGNWSHGQGSGWLDARVEAID